MTAEWPRVILPTSDAVRSFLAADPLYGAYALGYLAPPWQETTRELMAIGAGGDALALAVCRDEHLQPVLLVFGERRGLVALLSATDLAAWRRALRGQGQDLWLTGQPDALDACAGFFYHLEKRPLERYVADTGAVSRARWQAALGAAGVEIQPRQLQVADAPLLNGLYGLQPGDGFALEELERHAYYGIVLQTRERRGACVAAAGTHVVAPIECIAAIGNVFTAPAWRGHGYATACVAALCAHYARGGYHHIILNVDPANAPALRVYHRLGFRFHCAYQELRAVAL
ncbi:MAG: hypothetical protein NVSMB65_11920 [Chloroflexota bacterium]